MSRIYYWSRKLFANAVNSVLHYLGFYLVPKHYYEPLPDVNKLPDSIWEKQNEMQGVLFDKNKNMELLNTFQVKYSKEFNELPLHKTKEFAKYYIKNKRYDSVDGEVLYSMVREFKPRNIYEIGSGFSTFLSAQALLKNEEETGVSGNLIAYEPFPWKELEMGFKGLTEVKMKFIQDIPLSDFDKLGENDILFIDSTHVLKIGSDVQYEILDLLPRLNKGVIIHFHDIFLPHEYPKQWVKGFRRFWNEQYFLQAFLACNEQFEIFWGSSYLHLNHPEKLETIFRSYNRKTVWPASFWIRKIK